jgi:hypothetical protein
MFNPHEQKELCPPGGLPVAVAKVSLHKKKVRTRRSADHATQVEISVVTTTAMRSATAM